MSVSVSQISIDRSLDRSIDQSRLPGQSLDQFICVCRCLYKEQHPPNARSHFRREMFLHPADLFFFLSFSLFSSPTLDLLARPISTQYPRRREVPRDCAPREDCAVDICENHTPLNRGYAKRLRTNSRVDDTSERTRGRIHAGSVESRDRKEYCACRGTRRGGNARRKRRTMHRRPSWVPRTKLTRYANRLSTPRSCVYTDIYKYIIHICTYAYMCTCLYVCA